MKTKEGFALKEMAGTYVALYVGDGEDPLSGMVQMNETAAFLWEQLQKETTEDELVKAMTDSFDVDEEIARKDIAAVLDSMNQAGLIE